MGIKTTVALFMGFGVVVSYQAATSEPLFIGMGISWLIYAVHSIEVKLNKLLDHCGISVTQRDIDDG